MERLSVKTVAAFLVCLALTRCVTCRHNCRLVEKKVAPEIQYVRSTHLLNDATCASTLTWCRHNNPNPLQISSVSIFHLSPSLAFNQSIHPACDIATPQHHQHTHSLVLTTSHPPPSDLTKYLRFLIRDGSQWLNRLLALLINTTMSIYFSTAALTVFLCSPLSPLPIPIASIYVTLTATPSQYTSIPPLPSHRSQLLSYVLRCFTLRTLGFKTSTSNFGD